MLAPKLLIVVEQNKLRSRSIIILRACSLTFWHRAGWNSIVTVKMRGLWLMCVVPGQIHMKQTLAHSSMSSL